jgi:spermidine synthase
MNRYLYLTLFVSGMSTLAVEMAASHLMGPYFGDSRLVWASIIGLILIYLTAGYFLGGRWADRSPHYKTMYTILAWGAFTSGAFPLLSGPILRPAANAFDNLEMGILLGSFVAVLVLFSVPVTLLGMISPFAIRLAVSEREHTGSIAGKIYAISTLGSFVGTFLPVLLFIPWLGTRATFLIFSSTLLGVALIGLVLSSGWRATLRLIWMPVVLFVLGWLFVGMPYKTTAGQIYETESSYNYIQVLQRGESRYLRLNEGQGIHSEYNPNKLFYAGPWEQFLAAPFFNNAPYRLEQVKRIAIIGLAAGTTARQATAVFGAVPIDGFELDPKIIAVGQQFFEMTQPNLKAMAQDGRWGIAHSKQTYSLICVDAYRPPYIPWHLTTREFFQELHDHLDEDGVLAINVGRAPNDRRLIDALTGTLQPVFPSVFVIDLPNTFNSIVYASVKPTDWVNLYNNYVLLSKDQTVHPLLLETMRVAMLNRRPTPQNGLVMTDDRAPIEWITHSLILNFMLSGGTQNLQRQ